MMQLEVNNVLYTGFKSANVKRSLGSISGAFSVTVTNKPGQIYPIRRGDTCRLLINNTPVITGAVEIVNSSGSPGNNLITIQGRDKTRNIIDSCIGTDGEFKGGISLENLIRTAMTRVGITGISVINTVPGLRAFTELELNSDFITATLFNYFQGYAQKRQVLLTTDGNGNIVISRSGSNRISTLLLNKINGPNNNIKSYSLESDESKLYNTYIVHSQANISASRKLGALDSASLQGVIGVATDSSIEAGRVLHINAEKSSTSAEAAQRAIWERDTRKAKALQYSCTVQGFTTDALGTPWTPNTIVSIEDDFADIKSEMLLVDVTYNLTLDGGSQTTLRFVDKDSYNLQLAIENQQARLKTQGKKFNAR